MNTHVWLVALRFGIAGAEVYRVKRDAAHWALAVWRGKNAIELIEFDHEGGTASFRRDRLDGLVMREIR